MNFKLSCSCAVAVAALLLAPTFAEEKDPVVISSGSIAIKQSEFESAIASLPPEYQDYAKGPGRRGFADDFLRMRLLAAEGEKAGLEKDPLVAAQLSMLRQNVLATAQLKKIEDAINVSEDELRKSYEANSGEYEQAKARHVLIAFKGSPAVQSGKPELSEEQAKEKAEQIRESIVKGASFEEVAKKESDDVGSGAEGGSLGAFGRGQMVPEFEQAIFTAKAGEVAPVVRTQFGYHVIRVDEFTKVPFEEARATLESSAKQKLIEEKLKAMRGETEPQFNEAYFGTAGK